MSNLLPTNKEIEVKYLAAAFRNTTNSYKLYWFWAILDTLKTNPPSNGKIATNQLAIKMVSLSWYTVNYYKLSLGLQDMISSTIAKIKLASSLNEQSSKEEVEKICIDKFGSNKSLKESISALRRYVPYRFITSFFSQELKGLVDAKKEKKIKALSKESFSSSSNPCIYKFERGSIILHPKWQEYLTRNLKILEDFCLWNLVSYLQTRNPNVPNLGNKLFYTPQQRDLSRAKNFWKLVYQQSPIPCIYSNKELDLKDFSIDHFIPWSFVTHDALWNLTPTTKRINSAKNNNLPDLNQYLNRFTNQHFKAFQLVYKLKKKKLLEDYAIAFNDSLDNVHQYPSSIFKTKLSNQIKPLAQIASNLGFQDAWTYKCS
ncbi:MAG: HNH endonuclease [Aureispira sp.]|nr:HNH endonuclease [Aureispira sp.]